jgi:hypothetical protein
MSPDIHWHVGEDKDQETIVHASAPRRSRRSWIAVLIVVILGAGLGVAYRSLPEPVPRPTSTPPPTPQPTPTYYAVPARLYDTIDREAQALADGDRSTLDSIVDILNFEQYRALMDGFKAWGRPTNAAFYSIEDYRQLADDKAWVEVRQFHTDRFVQEVRFYQLRNDQWRRIEFDPSFWSGQVETADTPHFSFTYFSEDQRLIEALASVLEADYEQICRDFACPAVPETCVEALGQQWCSSFPRPITTTLILTNQTDQHDNFDLAANGNLTFTTQSPRLLDQFMPVEREHYFRNPLAWLHVMRLAYGNRLAQEMFEKPPPGHALVIVIFFRENDRLLERTGNGPQAMPDEFKQLDILNPPSLHMVWSAALDGADASQIYATAYSVVTYIAQEYGTPAVTRLLKAIGQASSFSEAIEVSLNVPFSEFDQKWQAWLNAGTQP